MPTWYAIYMTDTGALVSTGTSAAGPDDLAASGYSAISLSGDPTGQVWDAASKTFSPPPPPPNPSVITALDFIKRFTPAEYAGIRASTDVQVMMFLLELEHAIGGMVNLLNSDVQNGLAYLASISLLTPARSTEIGTP